MEQQDSHIIRRILGGVTEGYRILMDKYSSNVFGLVVRIVDNAEDAEEVTQDVFIKAFKSLSRFDGRSTFSTWLFRIAYNEAVSAVRKKTGRIVLVDDKDLKNIMDENVDSFFNSEDSRLIALPGAIDLLSPDERALLTLHYYEGLSLHKVAVIMNISESAAKVRLMRVRKKLYVLIKNIIHSI